MKKIDLIDLRKLINAGILEVYIKRETIYMKDVENGETIKIGNLNTNQKNCDYSQFVM